MKHRVNCKEPLRASFEDWAICSQALQECSEGSTTSAWSPERAVKHHERATPHVGDDIVWTARKLVEGGIKSPSITILEFIAEAILSYAVDYTVCAPFMRWIDLRGKSTNVASFPRWVLDTATDLTNEVTDATSIALETTQVSATGAEIGVFRRITDTAIELSTIGQALFDFLVRDTATLMAVSLDDDICAQTGPN